MEMRRRALFKAMASNWLVIVTCFVILLLNIVFYYFFVRGQQEDIACLERQYSKVRSGRVMKGEDRLERLSIAKRDLDRFIATVPEESTFPRLVHQVYSIIQKNNLRSSTMAFKPQHVGHLALTRYATSFKVKGTYGQIKQFLAQLLDSKDLFCIDGFVIERSGEGNNISMTLNLSLYLK